MAKSKRKTQQTLESTLGRSRIATPTITPKSVMTRSAMKQSKLPSSPAAASASKASASSSPFTKKNSSSPAVKNEASSSSPAAFMSSQAHNLATGSTPTRLPVHTRSFAALPGRDSLVSLDNSSSESEAEEGGFKAPEMEEEEFQAGVRDNGRRRRQVVFDSGSDDEEDHKVMVKKEEEAEEKEEEEEEEEEEEDSDEMPLTTPKRKERKRPLTVDSDEESDQPVRSSPVKRRRVIAVQDESDEEEEDQDDEESDVAPVRRLVRRNAPSSPVAVKDSDEEESEVPPVRKLSRTKKKPLTAKDKARELLRRKRAGEIVEDEDEYEESEDEEGEAPRKALYDTDSDNLALDEFEDDEESEEQKEAKPEKEKQNKKKKKDKKKKDKDPNKGGDDENGEPMEEDLEDFVVDDSDEPLGIPDEILHTMPIEFTRASHKPLKDHFRDVVEWLVHYKINPGFVDKTHTVYNLAWRKLDDEVRALADSKFSSSAWKPDFYKALRARPYYDTQNIIPNAIDLTRHCAACGRSGHPAKWAIRFTGTPYHRSFGPDFLNPIEPDSDSDLDGSAQDEDEDGNPIPKDDTVWHIGNVCNDNAEISHTLLHWKNSLLDWVDARLMEDGHMLPERLAERARWKPKKLYKLVDEIVEGWEKQRVIKSLFGDFKKQLETARNQGTGGRRRRY